MTDLRPSGHIRISPMGSGAGSAIGGPSHLLPRGVDVVVVVVVLAVSVVNVASQDAAGISGIPAAGLLMLASASVALLWRRRWPLAVLALALAISVAWTSLGNPGNPVLLVLVSLYAVGRHVPGWRISLAALAVAVAVVGFGQATDGDPVSEVVAALIVTTLPWYVGRRVRIRGDHVAVAREAAEHLEWMRATEAQRAIADARAGIARELHDVVAHNVTVMTVQAGVARLVVADDPERAQEAIGAVEEAGRRALNELRHLLDVLRPEAASDELGPQPVLTQVHALVDQLRQTGMTISLAVDLPSEPPVRVDLFAYRIVQEALTNVLKHGGVDATAQVRLEQSDGSLEIEVQNTGMATSTPPGSGRGIVGMQERALLLGGIFEAGPRPEGGFRVFARLPMGDQ
jgi:signal transduction histidine kinase